MKKLILTMIVIMSVANIVKGELIEQNRSYLPSVHKIDNVTGVHSYGVETKEGRTLVATIIDKENNIVIQCLYSELLNGVRKGVCIDLHTGNIVVNEIVK